MTDNSDGEGHLLNFTAMNNDTRKVILGVSWVISGGRYDDGPPPWGIMGVEDISP